MADPDATGTELRSLAFPNHVAVSGDEAWVTFSVGTLASADIGEVFVVFDNGWQGDQGEARSLTLRDANDSFSDGLSSTRFLIDSSSLNGTYTIQYVLVVDKSGGYRSYFTDELVTLGLQTSFTVSGGPGELPIVPPSDPPPEEPVTPPEDPPVEEPVGPPFEPPVEEPVTPPLPGTGQASADFNGDGHSDILWRNADGSVSTWAVGAGSDGGVVQGAWFGSADRSWRITETFDHDGDGRSDILWRHADGAIAIWGATANGFSASTYFHAPVAAEWRIAGTGDLNGDGRDDILWQYRDGSLSSWNAAGDGFAEGAWNHGPVGGGWTVEGLADFNGDGRDDILWTNPTGVLSAWLGDGSGGYVLGSDGALGVPTSWQVDGLADFNGDGRDDILWRNEDGAISTWLSNGSGFDQGVFFGSASTSWQVAQTGDFDRDGRADILWRHDSGLVSTWESNGAAFDAGVYGAFVDNSWSIAAHPYL